MNSLIVLFYSQFNLKIFLNQTKSYIIVKNLFKFELKILILYIFFNYIKINIKKLLFFIKLIRFKISSMT